MKFLLPPDEGLLLDVPPDLLSLVEGWLPDRADLAGEDGGGEASPISDRQDARDEVDASHRLFGRIRLSTGPLAPDAPDAKPTLRLGAVRAWASERGLTLHAAGGLSGRIAPAEPNERDEPDEGAGRAELTVAATDDGVVATAAAALPDALTIAAACLLAAYGHALMHAGAVLGAAVGGDAGAGHGGHAWLVAGDARAGKSSTIAALVEAGHDWLSDDQVVLSPGPDHGPPVVHGWPRTVHLDSGWEEGRPTGERVDRSAEQLGPGRLVGRAPVRGVLLPEVHPEGGTRLEEAHPAAALTALLRQSPWLMAMPRSATPVLGVLEHVARLPCHRLVLGRDAFANGPLLSSLLRDAGRPA